MWFVAATAVGTLLCMPVEPFSIPISVKPLQGDESSMCTHTPNTNLLQRAVIWAILSSLDRKTEGVELAFLT